jgi:hypothetical protein
MLRFVQIAAQGRGLSTPRSRLTRARKSLGSQLNGHAASMSGGVIDRALVQGADEWIAELSNTYFDAIIFNSMLDHLHRCQVGPPVADG